MSEETLYDFGFGPVPAHRHPNGGGWVADTAHVYGDAYVCGDAIVSRSPIFIDGLRHRILVSDNLLAIGCQQHTVKCWENFDDQMIQEMDDGALEWWNQYKHAILTLTKLHHASTTD